MTAIRLQVETGSSETRPPWYCHKVEPVSAALRHTPTNTASVDVATHLPLACAFLLPPGTHDWEMENAMTTLVKQKIRMLQLPSWMPYGTIPSWLECAENTRATRAKLERHVGHDVKKIILSVAHGAPVPDIAHEEEQQWLNSRREHA